jgi:GMP synthase-like glutamine amidotransferase
MVAEATMSSSFARSDRTVLEQMVGSGSTTCNRPHRLRLMMLGCEDKPPYGPTNHTGALFLDIICKSLQELTKTSYWIVTIVIYHVQQFDYPASAEEWDSYDGILLPGSFSAAYGDEIWIKKLRQVILDHVYGRPTLGICFGHQIFAHSFFPDGEAVKSPAGSQAGRKSFSLTEEGSSLFLNRKKKTVDLYYTHGDMVQKLPTCAVSLGGTETEPNQAAAYFHSEQEATTNTGGTRPIAITFQAHPEYASPQLGLHMTLGSILSAMESRGDFTSEEEKKFRQDAIDHYATVERDSIDVIKTVGILLGWFPEE